VYSRTRSSKYLEEQRKMVVEAKIPYERITSDPADKVEYLYNHQTGTKFVLPEKSSPFFLHDMIMYIQTVISYILP
jgi:hypothetical protein